VEPWGFSREDVRGEVAGRRAIVEEDLVLARRAVVRVLGHNSELSALWGEGGPDGAWHAHVRVLLLRLGGDPDDTTSPDEALTGKAREQAARGLEPSAKEMARILESRDPVDIRTWLARALDALSVADMLDVRPS
jgi:hypothetical protein